MTRTGPRRRRIVVALLAAAVLTGMAAFAAGTAGAQSRPPSYDPNFAVDVAPRPCALDVNDPYEKQFYEIEGWKGPDYERYPGACQRMRFSYGPIVVKPGQNDIFIGPVTIEKPNRDGYITRFKPNLVRSDGSVPPVEQVHLHHGTWLSASDYGDGPFFAAGEEKTIAPWPRGYGMPIKASDSWLLLHMVHSAVSQTMETYITYEVDFIPQDKAQALGMKPAVPVWLDVRPSGYPVFNVQREFGGSDGLCTWPKEKCANFDPYGKPFVGQGRPGNGTGTDFKLPNRGQQLGVVRNFTGGTLIGIGGHLHPGGIQNDIDLVRPGGANVRVRERERYRVKTTRMRRGRCTKRRRGRCVRRAKRGGRRGKCIRRRRGVCVRRQRARPVYRYRDKWVSKHVSSSRIYNGRAHYWDRRDPRKAGGPPTSWDFSMEVQGLPKWAVRVKPGDVLRSNATYETEIQASYENMGISVALLAPDTAEGRPTAPGIDVFEEPWRSPDGPWDDGRDCGPRNGTLCEEGAVTHGHYKENGNYGGASGNWTATRGPQTNEVAIANFLYAPGDLSTKSSTGIPTVKLGSNLRFTNGEGNGIYHTVTTCRFPCLGQTGSAFPLADGTTSKGRSLDLDSSELGIGAPEVGAASQRLDWSVPVTRDQGFAPGETVTYFCRIHPFMRGAFEVTE